MSGLVLPARWARPGGSSIYEALTDWIDLAPAIKAAWDAGPDSDPGSYHPDNDGDWTLTHTPGSPGTLTLAGTTGGTIRDGWSEGARFDAGLTATILGVTTDQIADTDTVVQMRARPLAFGSHGGAPGLLIQASAGASPPAQMAEGVGAGLRFNSATVAAGWSGASATGLQAVGGSMGAGFTLLTSAQHALQNGEVIRLTANTQEDGSLITGGTMILQLNAPDNIVLTATSRLWVGAFQATTTAAAFDGFAFSMEARVLRRLAVPWDPDFGL